MDWTIINAGAKIALVIDKINDGYIRINETNTPPHELAAAIVDVIDDALDRFNFDDYYEYIKNLKSQLIAEIDKL